MSRHPLVHFAGLPATLASAVIFCTGTPSSAEAAASPTRQPASVTAMFGVLRDTSPTPLPDREAHALTGLRHRVPGSRVQLDTGQTRRIGPRTARLYLIPGTNGICVVHGSHGACSDSLTRLSTQGVRFSVAHRQDPETGEVPIDLYGALPDGLTTVSVTPYQWVHPKLVGTNAHRNGYVLHLPGTISTMMISGPGGGASLGPLGS